MPIHDQVLAAALRLCRRRRVWTFTADEIVLALPHLNPRSIRTHVVSRCCVNAPKNHPHKWDYFRRIGRGLYEVLPPWRRKSTSPRPPAGEVKEPEARYAWRAVGRPRDTIHAVVRLDRSTYVAECLELAVVTQASSLDELVTNLKEAIELHLEGESHATLGLTARPRLAVQYELPALGDGA